MSSSLRAAPPKPVLAFLESPLISGTVSLSSSSADKLGNASSRAAILSFRTRIFEKYSRLELVALGPMLWT
jgi:hypothetical protein